jgi:hypothetical protein
VSGGLHAADFELAASPVDVSVAPGAYADVQITVSNNTDTASPDLTLDSVASLYYGYALQDSPGCGPLTSEMMPPDGIHFALSLSSIPAHDQRTCTLRVLRDSSESDSTHQLWSLWEPSYAAVTLRLGTFVDVALTSEQVAQEVSAAGVHTITKLRVHNAGTIAVDPFAYVDACIPRVEFDADLAGACPVEPPYCGVSVFSPAIAVLPRVEAGASGECLIGTTISPWESTVLFAGVAALYDAATGGMVMDPDASNDLAIISTPEPVVLNQYGLSGSWANADTPGQGLVVNVQPDFYGEGRALFFGGWFTYERSGSGDRRWYTLQGTLDGTSATMPIYLTRGGRLDSAQPTRTSEVGTATLRFADCTHGELAYSIAETPTSESYTGTAALARLLSNVGCTPAGDADAPSARYAMSGTWADAGTEGQGLVVDIDTQRNVLFGAWYTFTAAADVEGGDGPRWYTLQAITSPDATEATSIGLYETRGGRFDAGDPTSTTQVGTARLVLHSCTSATFAYVFTAGDNAGSEGTLDLARLGDAPPGCAL